MKDQFACVLVISDKKDVKVWRNELYRRTQECASRFPEKHTKEYIPLTIGTGKNGSALGIPIFGNYEMTRNWFESKGIATREVQLSQVCKKLIMSPF